jgi:hypothetical protein
VLPDCEDPEAIEDVPKLAGFTVGATMEVGVTGGFENPGDGSTGAGSVVDVAEVEGPKDEGKAEEVEKLLGRL